ncbi:MAG: imidazolonepropionase [Pseudomonadota bacterium]
MPDRLKFTDATLATLDCLAGYGLIEQAVLVMGDGIILYAGPEAELPDEFAEMPRTPLSGRLVTPGLIDCHTHLIYGGSRAREFEMRLNGASYEEIAQSGGGIFSTVMATRQASDEDLEAAVLERLDRMLAAGVTTVEIKSGYGLDQDTELRILRIARKLPTVRPVRVMTTFLGAHAVPKGTDADRYLDGICLPTLRLAASEGLVDAVDGFCEGIAFSPAQIDRVFEVAKELSLPIKLHAEQLSNLGGAKLAAEHGALSADHLEYLDSEGVNALAAAGSVAVLLPGAFYFLKETRRPPIQALRDAGVSMAIATDSNPGTSPMTSLLLAANMAATLFGLTPEETLRGITANGARALGQSHIGTIRAGQTADLAVWNISHPAELTYRIGDAPLHQRIFGGTIC